MDPIQTQALEVVNAVKALVIETPEQFEDSAYRLKAIKGFATQWKEKCEPSVTSTKKAYDEAKKMRDSILVPLSEAEISIKSRQGVYLQRLREKEENERRIAEQESRKREEEIRLSQAEQLEKAGFKEAADEALSAPIITTSAPTPKTNTHGISLRKNYKARVINMVALVQAVASGKADIDCLMPNQTFLNSLARAKEDKLTLAGVEVYNDAFVNAGR